MTFAPRLAFAVPVLSGGGVASIIRIHRWPGVPARAGSVSPPWRTRGDRGHL